jgi:hypothetical protein
MDPITAGRPFGMAAIRVIDRWHLEHAGGAKIALVVVVMVLEFAILLTV